jgi:3alpha(or 20beta)-hydroxysteroid dehydrogenase
MNDRAPDGRRLTGRVAIVTGAAGGIGAAVSTRFVAEGAGVLVTDVDGDACAELAAKLSAGNPAGRAVGCRLDVTSGQDWAAAVRLARRRFGYPDVLVNNAGLLGLSGLQDMTGDEWSRVVEVCQSGTYLGMSACVRSMRMAGGGAVVNVASVFGLVGTGGAFAYHAAKGAVRAMTTAAAIELAAQGIRVNAVLPGLVRTPMTDGVPAPFVANFVADTPLRRAATPDEIANVVLFLACDESSYMTGAEVVVDGGYTAR